MSDLSELMTIPELLCTQGPLPPELAQMPSRRPGLTIRGAAPGRLELEQRGERVATRGTYDTATVEQLHAALGAWLAIEKGDAE